MVTKYKALTMLFIIALTTLPLHAQEIGRTIADISGATTLSSIIEKASTALKPVLEMNKITISITANSTLKTDASNVEERFMNLMTNAIVHAPAGTELKVSYDSASSQLSVWVENNTVSSTVKREVTDSMGNTFTLETTSGKGTLYAINL
ncbi:MAG: hypothetical protein RDV48_04360 [Candidatus Eremiobacteraeota bacterium]|nr:hypothetical protein [Candidatus Eremiobacteraeota bacterium]